MNNINNWFRMPAFWGFLLILGGIAMLIQNVFNFALGGLFWGAAFALGGAAFLVQLNREERPWWPLIPGVSLLGIGLAILVETILPRMGDFFTGGLILGGIGLAFLLVFLRERQNWWALIPAGVMLTLAVVATLDQSTTGIDTGGIFLLGLGGTFLVLAWLPDQNQRWAYIPGTILAVIGLLVASASGAWFSILGPAMIILVGGWLVFRSLSQGRGG